MPKYEQIHEPADEETSQDEQSERDNLVTAAQTDPTEDSAEEIELANRASNGNVRIDMDDDSDDDNDDRVNYEESDDEVALGRSRATSFSSDFHSSASTYNLHLEAKNGIQMATEEPHKFLDWWPKFLEKTKRKIEKSRDFFLVDSSLQNSELVMNPTSFKWKRVKKRNSKNNNKKKNPFTSSATSSSASSYVSATVTDHDDEDEDEENYDDPGNKYYKRGKPSCVQRYVNKMMDKLPAHWHFATLYLILLGSITAILGAIMDIFIYYCTWARFEMLQYSEYKILQFLMWLTFQMGFLMLALFLTQKIAPSAAGSGVPEMKTILSGIPLPASVSGRTLISKLIGLSLAMASGLSIGKVGAFVHIGGMVAVQLARLPIFNKIQRNYPVMQMMLGAGAAVGYATSLGAPLGGVMLSVEVTSAYYPVRNYWFAFVAVISGSLGFRYLRNMLLRNPGLDPIVNTKYFGEANVKIGIVELAVFVALGAVCGLFGVAFIKLNALAVKTYRNIIVKRFKIFQTPYTYAAIIVFLTSVFTFPGFIGKFMSLPGFLSLQDTLIEDMKSSEHLEAKDWTRYPLIVSLLMSYLLRFLLTAVTPLIPIPAGLFAPVLAGGGSLGRVFGEVANFVLAESTWLYEGEKIMPGGYAIAGAAAFAAGVTHTLSSAIIILEITSQIGFLLPTLIAVTTSVAIAKKFSSLSIFDSLTKLRGLPYLPDVQQLSYEVYVRDFMNTRVKYITLDFKFEQIIKLLADKDYTAFPVVDSDAHRLLIGEVDRETLEKAVNKYFEKLRRRQHAMARGDKNLAELPDGAPRTAFQSVPIQLSETTPLIQVHMMFITLRLRHAYITINGRLVGRVTRNDLVTVIAKKDYKVTVLND